MVKVIDCGSGWIAIDKPAGMSVHNDPDKQSDAISLVSELLHRDGSLAKTCEWTPGTTISPVHRLDRETSGVLLLATKRESASVLQKAFEMHQTRKVYRAVLRGSLKEKEGRWTFPLTDKAEGRRQPAGHPLNRKPCSTNFRVVRQNQYLTEIEVALETGRQHQIRRHAALAGHSIVGDNRYGDPKYNFKMKQRFSTSRLFLHASSLDITLDEKSTIHLASPLPTEFDGLW